MKSLLQLIADLMNLERKVPKLILTGLDKSEMNLGFYHFSSTAEAVPTFSVDQSEEQLPSKFTGGQNRSGNRLP